MLDPLRYNNRRTGINCGPADNDIIKEGGTDNIIVNGRGADNDIISG